MHSITCIIQQFDAAADTCSVELAGIGIIDAWIDGVAIAPTVDRAFIVGGAPGVITMPDINRPCDATLIQVTPPGTPVSYNPDQIVVYTGSLSIPTDSSGAGCENVVFPTPYSTTPLVSASAAHPASVTISNITESGFTACVTGGKVSSRHSVSYSAKSSNTSTATKNKALTVDHNEVDVGTHYILDFKDGDVVWTVTDHSSGPARNQVEATLSDAFKATLGSGAGGTRPGAANYGISTDQFQAGGDLGLTVAWDHIIAGDDKYLDPTNTDGLTIPPGGGGDYDLETTLVVHTGVAPTFQPWVLAYDLYIQLWRAGAMLWQQGRHDQYTQDPTDTPPWNFPQLSDATAVPNTHVGDVIKVFWLGHITGHDGTAYTGSSIDNFVDDLTWVSIIPTGQGSGVTGHQLKLSAPGGDSGTPGNWLYDASHSNPAASFTDAPFPGLPALLDPDHHWDPTSSEVTIGTGQGGTYLLIYTLNWELNPGPAITDSIFITLAVTTLAEQVHHSGVATDDGTEFTAGTFADTTEISFLAQLPDGATFQPLISMTTNYRVLSDLLEFSLVKLS